MEALIKQICPDFPQDGRKIVETSATERFFWIDYPARTLYVPAKRILHVRMDLISTLVESVCAFAKIDLRQNKCPYDWDNVTYEVIQSPDELQRIILQRLQPGEIPVACDIETRGLDYIDNKVISIGFYSGEGSVIIVPWEPEFKDVLQELFDDPRYCFIWHNGKFDITRLRWLTGLLARVDEDTMLMHYIGINETRGTHSLKDLGQLYLGAPKWDEELDRIKKEWCRVHRCKLADFKYDYFTPEVLYPYQARDCVATYRLWERFQGLMRSNSRMMYRQLVVAANVYARVELNGVYIDKEYLEDLEWDLEQKIRAAEKEIHEIAQIYWNPTKYAIETGAKCIANMSFNYKSPKQLKWILEKVVGHKLESTDKSVIEHLSDDYPFIRAIKNMRKLTKYMDTYVQGFRDVIAHDGRIHASFNLHGTETGRLSSSDPNMQNIPRDKVIKNLIIAAPGTKLVQFDYSQAELRVLAYLSGDEFLTGVYQRGEDLHDAVATKMFGPGFTKEQRVKAKTINFGIAYGRGPASLVETFGITMGEAKKLISDWFDSMPKVKKYIDETRAKVYRQGEAGVCSTPFGRQRSFTITYDKINHIQNEMVNFAIQSIASDCTLLSLIRIDHMIGMSHLRDRVKIISSVHDSIILEVDDDPTLIDWVASMGIKVMSSVPADYLDNCKVPFKADVEVGIKWGELEKWGLTQ